jgi:hypothetical protein
MITRADIEAEFLARAMVANNSAQFPATRVTDLVQDAYLWAGTLYFWPPLYRSRKFSSKPNTQSLNYDYYDYPVDFLTNSISRLYINGLKYEKKAFQDFLDYCDQSNAGALPPDTSKRYFAEFARQFFIYPTVSVAGSEDGLVWGNIQPLQLGSPTDKTIFSLWNDSGNEAILKKALSVGLERLDPPFAAQQKQEAIQLLQVIWNKIVTEAQRSQRLDHSFFSVPDMFGAQSGVSTIGNFNGVDVIS